jgi:hypothetical protein
MLPVATAMLAVACLSATAQAVPGANDRPITGSAGGPEAITYQPPPTIIERIPGLKVSLTQVNFPGVPERSACRLMVRASNEGSQRIAVHALVRTFNSAQASLNTWLIPTGDLAPGQSVERIYSCKMAQEMTLDQASASGWPGRCTIDGEERSPCPATLVLETNLRQIPQETARK